MTGVEMIAAERQRQMDVEGWTPEHDDSHGGGQMVEAAEAYSIAARACLYSVTCVTFDGYRPGESPPAPRTWPWSDDWWKPSAFPIRNLVKAGALIAAEIDRLQRLAPSTEEGA